MQTYEQASAENKELTLDEYKRCYQQQCREDVKSGSITEESMHLFDREMAAMVKIEYRDVDYGLLYP
jgi:Zn/Cd-binding protein ZinT